MSPITWTQPCGLPTWYLQCSSKSIQLFHNILWTRIFKIFRFHKSLCMDLALYYSRWLLICAQMFIRASIIPTSCVTPTSTMYLCYECSLSFILYDHNYLLKSKKSELKYLKTSDAKYVPFKSITSCIFTGSKTTHKYVGDRSYIYFLHICNILYISATSTFKLSIHLSGLSS